MSAYETLTAILDRHAEGIDKDSPTPGRLRLVSRKPSPFPQHKGRPLELAYVVEGKSYTSFHLLPLYMHEPLKQTISPALKKRMQGKSCFNFKRDPEAALVRELDDLVARAIALWRNQGWL